MTGNPHQNANVLFWIQQQQRKVESEASSNLARLRSVRRLADAVRLGDVHLPPELRAMRQAIPGLRTLESGVKRRLQELVTEGLKDVFAKNTVEEAKQQRGHFMRECQALRGKYAEFYRQADAESARHVYLLEKAAKEAPPAPPEPPLES